MPKHIGIALKKYVSQFLGPYIYLLLIIFVLVSTIVFLTLKNRLAQNAYSVPLSQDRCVTRAQCQFYESCVSQHCQHNSEWVKQLTPEEALAIYQRLKTDLGIDIPVILDKERVDRLEDTGLILAASNNPCAVNSYLMALSNPGISSGGSCYVLRATNKDYREATEKMTLQGILEATYPDLTETEIVELTEMLKTIANNRGPRAALEQVLFSLDVIDLFTTDPRDVYRGIVTLLTNAKKVKLLPQLLSSASKLGKYYVSREGLEDLLTIARNRGTNFLDYASQFAPRLRQNWQNRPAKIIQLGDNQIRLWRSYDILSPEDDRSFVMLFAEANRILREKVGLSYDALDEAWPYFSDRFDLITPGYSDTAAVYIRSQKVMVINIDFLDRMLISETVHSGIHEKIHYLINRSGLTTSIYSTKNPFSYYCADIRYCMSFEEGMTDLLARSIMQKAGAGWNAYGSYQEQVESVIQLVNYSQDAEVLFASIREGSFRPLLSKIYKMVNGKYVPWTIEDLQRWIEGITPISKIGSQIRALFKIRPVAAVAIDYISPQLFNYYPVIEENQVNEAAYNLASELSRSMEERNLEEISLDTETLKMFMLAAASLDEGKITLEFLEEFVSDLNQYVIMEPLEEENNETELIEIGKGPKPLFKEPPKPTVVYPSITPIQSPQLSPSIAPSPSSVPTGGFRAPR